MPAKKYKCRVLEKKLLTPTVFSVRFESNRRIKFEPGQFISVSVPCPALKKPLRRVYSFSSAPDQAKQNGYELCIKLVPGGKGSTFLAQIRPGETFVAQAPFGDMCFKAPERPDRSLCFIATGSGIAPIKSFLESEAFKMNRPKKVTLLLGAQKEEDIIYRNHFEKLGVEVVYCLSKAEDNWLGFKGRVTDYLRQLPAHWNWHSTDYYMCGNGKMLQEVHEILHGGHGVSLSAIHQEAFALTPYNKKAAVAALEEKRPPLQLAVLMGQKAS